VHVDGNLLHVSALHSVDSVDGVIRCNSTGLYESTTALVGFSFSRRVLNISELIASSWV